MLELVESIDQDHLRIMATHFSGTIEKGEGASFLEVGNHHGNGTISCYDLFPGLTVWIYNLVYYKKFEVELTLSENGPIYFCYNVKGEYGHRLGPKGGEKTVLENQNMIFSGFPGNNVYISFPTEKKLEIAVIAVDLEKLKISESLNAKKISDGLGTLFRKASKQLPYLYLGRINTETAKLASVLFENNDSTLVGQLLTEGAVLNMLATQLMEFDNADINIGQGTALTKAELSRITSLEDYIMQNLQEKLTVKKLSQHYGISQRKLQLGVKQLYGYTVCLYVSNIRTGHAEHLFKSSDLNVGEIAREVGIPNLAYFSLLFKKRFGISPSNYRQCRKRDHRQR
ncbi:helix-turn-helix transcriptional regulator [Maribacter litoralis]|uniref:AraC family transcriptional regulator n=1 Tax=Maribacter litoralis TaxID=2059726 RepID=UPI003F5CC497